MDAQALRQSAGSTDGADWVTVAEAASLTGQTVHYWQRIASSASARGLSHKAYPPSLEGGRVWWLHRSLDHRLRRRPAKPACEDPARESLLAKYPTYQVELAYRKAACLRKWRETYERGRLTKLEAAAQIVAEARSEHGPDFRISRRTLQRWRCLYTVIGKGGRIRGVEALIDGRSMPTRSAGGGHP